MVAAKTNGFDPDKTKSFVEGIEACDRALEKEHMDYMKRCKKHHEQKRAIYDDAKSTLQIPKQSLKAVIKARALERKAEKAREDLEDIDLVDKFDLIRHALGDLADLPLGQAAMSAATNGGDQAEGAPV